MTRSILSPLTELGQIVLIRTLSAPYSIAQVFVKPIKPHFEAAYEERRGVPMNDEVEPILIIDPPPDSFSRGIADLLQRNAPFKLTLIVCFQSMKSVSSSLAEGPAMPALLINALISPKCFLTAAKRDKTSSSSDTSAFKAMTSGLF